MSEPTTLRTIAELREWREKIHPKKVAFVPTMGALHQGHLALVKKARESVGEDGVVLVSIFVNPLQFDRKSDLETYPVTFPEDREKCSAAGVDAIFAPQVDDFYNLDHSTSVSESQLTQRLCGATREGHFDGVCTVVLKLFNLSRADIAVFGQKDYQQLAVVKRMVRDLSVPIRIIGLETYRESDGLALSSRNVRLSEAARRDAPRIYEALQLAKEARSVRELLQVVRGHVEASPLSPKIDYLEVLDAETLQEVSSLKRPVVIAIAVFYDDVRLIDNIVLR